MYLLPLVYVMVMVPWRTPEVADTVFSTPDDGCMTPETCRVTWQRINVCILLHRVWPLLTLVSILVRILQFVYTFLLLLRFFIHSFILSFMHSFFCWFFRFPLTCFTVVCIYRLKNSFIHSHVSSYNCLPNPSGN